jgi:pyruvate/2-oxoglutarate dehydrogenase complex dihydrolipoamide acyltransferase (E2) component
MQLVCGVEASYTRGRIVMATKKKAAKKSTKKAAAKKSSAKKTSSSRKYGPSVGQDVEREMKAMEEGKLKSGRSGKKVTSRKQAIAIALSEARKEGKKVPPAKKK